MKLTGVMLGSENSKTLGEFYTKIFGTPGWRHEDWYGFEIGGGTLMVGMHSDVKGKNVSPGRVMFTIESDDLKNDFARIKEIGAEVVAEPYQPGEVEDQDIWLATFADPDGNYFQLATPWKS